MTNNLFIGGFPYETTENELMRIFGACGRVLKVRMLTERDTGRSRGLAFILMERPEEAAAAIAKLNGTNVGGRKIFVSEAREKGERPAGGPQKPGFVERRSGLDRRKPWDKKPERKPWEPKPWERKKERKSWDKKPGGFKRKKWDAGGPGRVDRPKRRFGGGFGKSRRP